MNQKIGRNDFCPCGSGKKYKTCCLSKQSSRSPKTLLGRCKPVLKESPQQNATDEKPPMINLMDTVFNDKISDKQPFQSVPSNRSKESKEE